MKLSLRDIITIALVSLLTFPVLYFAMLFVNGSAKIVFTQNNGGDESDSEDLKILKLSKNSDSLISVHSQSYLALEKERKEVEQERIQLERQQERISILTQELEKKHKQLVQEREIFEKLVVQNGELEMKRIKQLAKVYGSMRANEAARILETLDDALLIKIISAMGDDRQKAKIMASLSQAKASRISKIMGKTKEKTL